MKLFIHSRLLAAAFLSLCLFSSCDKPTSDAEGGDGEAKEEKTRLAFVTNGVANFWKYAEVGAKKAGEDLGIDVQVLMPAGGITEQKTMLEDLITRGVDGVAVSPIAPDDQLDILNQVSENALLVTHDSDAPKSGRLAYVGMDNYTAGRMGGKLVKEALPDGGSVMILIGRIEQDNSKLRRQGLIDELLDRSIDPSRYDPPGKPLEGEKYTILGTLTDQFDQAKSKANAEDTVTRYPDVSAMVGLFEYNPPSIIQALDQAGKLNEIKIIGFDENFETLAGIKNGTVYGTVVQNPYMYGYKSIEILNAVKNGDKSVIPEAEFIDFPGRLIRKDNVDEFWADLKQKLGQE